MRPYFLNLTIKSFFNVFVSIYLLFKDLLFLKDLGLSKLNMTFLNELDIML